MSNMSLLWQGIRRMREKKETVILHSCPQFPKMYLLHFNWMSQMKATTSWNCGLRFMSFGFAWRTEWYKTRPGSYSINNEKGANSVSVWGICIQKLVMLVYSKQNADTVGCMNHDMSNQSTNLLSTLILLLFMCNLGCSINLFHE